MAITATPIPREGFFTTRIKRAKRMCFLAATAALARNYERRGRDAIVEKIDQIFHLCNEQVGSKSLLFPYQVSSIVFNGARIYSSDLIALKADPTSEDARTQARLYVSRAPKWLHYADQAEMVNDVVLLFTRASALIAS